MPEETVAAIKRRAARHGRSVQQELLEVLERVAAEPVLGGRPRRLNLRTVATGHVASLERADFCDDDER